MKKCRVCKAEFEPKRPMQICCSLECAIAHTRKLEQKKREKAAKERRRETRERKQAMKRRGEWLAEAQTAFNKYIRLRDKGQPCISCGRNSGCKVNAGHYRSVGAAPELRFEEDNVHLQCEHCNCHKSGNAIDYRINLIKKIGVERVEWLEGPHEAKKYTVDEIKDIKAHYSKLARELERAEG